MPAKSFKLLQYSFVVQDGMAVGEMEMVTTEMETEMMEAMEIMALMAMVAVIRAMDRTAESVKQIRDSRPETCGSFNRRDSPNHYTLTCHQIIVICGKNVTVCTDLMLLMSNHTSRTMAILKDNMEADKTATIMSTTIITITTTTTILTRLALLDTDDMCKRI